MRLQKFLSMAGVCSRRKGESLIREGSITVNGKTVTELGTKVDPEKDRVEFNGTEVTLKSDLLYIALNKPAGYVTSCHHPGEKIILDLIDVPLRIYPIGRLDKDSTGLILLTNDGDLHQRLAHPSFDHEKEYEVTVEDPIPDSALKKMASGMVIGDTKTRPATLKRLGPRRFGIILKEGRNRQIRRMVKQSGNRVTRLKRVRISGIRLGKLPEGGWRHLTGKERADLLAPPV